MGGRGRMSGAELRVAFEFQLRKPLHPDGET